MGFSGSICTPLAPPNHHSDPKLLHFIKILKKIEDFHRIKFLSRLSDFKRKRKHILNPILFILLFFFFFFFLFFFFFFFFFFLLCTYLCSIVFSLLLVLVLPRKLHLHDTKLLTGK